MALPSSLERPISPPPISKKRNHNDNRSLEDNEISNTPTLAYIEAGKSTIRNHLEHFCYHLGYGSRPVTLQEEPRLSIPDFATLYQRNQYPNGHHFVIHQHKHPVAGVHYDLRLQFSETSTVSFAIPYGLPGNPNSRRQGRLAIETRVHNLWNNLIESASHSTGSLLIWDTGEYQVLPRKTKKVGRNTDDEDDSENEYMSGDKTHENEKLVHAFQTRYIRLRLQGARLPENYTMTLRLPSANNQYNQPRLPSRKRRKRSAPTTALSSGATTDSDDVGEISQAVTDTRDLANSAAVATASDDEDETSNIIITNSYPGATNSISSIHQRHWFVTLDKTNSGLVKTKAGPEKGMWVPAPGKSFKTFFVRGAEVERSIITGRTSDEGVEGFLARKMWTAVLD
jgi:hypothetical protein